MGDSFPHPKMDWSMSDRAQGFKEFKQLANMWFTVKKTKVEDQHNYIILWTGREGLRMFNTWGLTNEQLKDPKNVWEKFSQQIEPPENFRIDLLEFQRFRQSDAETVDDFFTRCKEKSLKCKFQTAENRDERTLEVLISGVKYPEVQKILLGKDNTLELKEALDIARTHEATSTHMQQFKNIGSHTSNIDAVSHHGYKMCGNCGRHHAFTPRENCPAHKDKCHNCGCTGHWKIMCHSRRTQNISQEPTPGGRSSSRNRREYRPRGRGRGWSRGRGRGQGRTVNATQHDRGFESEVENEFDQMSFESVEAVECDTVTSSDKRDEIYVSLDVRVEGKAGTHKLKAKMDMGAQGNILPVRIFHRMFPSKLD